MNQPNPWILFTGGIALFNVAFILGSAKLPPWGRYGLMLICVAMGVACMVIGFRRQFQKRPPRQKYQSKRKSRDDRLPPAA